MAARLLRVIERVESTQLLFENVGLVDVFIIKLAY